jgi:hypothetical protein
MKKYLSDRELKKELLISKNIGKRTPELEKMFWLLGKNVIRKMTYRDEEQRKDCLMSGVLRLLEYWDHFDEDKYDNAFSLYTEIFKRAIAAEFNRLNYKDRLTGEYRNHLSFTAMNEDNKSFDRF